MVTYKISGIKFRKTKQQKDGEKNGKQFQGTYYSDGLHTFERKIKQSDRSKSKIKVRVRINVKWKKKKKVTKNKIK